MNLSVEDRALIARCIRQAADGGFYDDVEFGALFGLDRDQMRLASRDWECRANASSAAAIGALNNLLGYPHGERTRQVMLGQLGVDMPTLARVLAALASAQAGFAP